ncbi:MAG: hypothetical protein ABIG89_02445 [Candidatus Woesearchaeota archaeon]
MVNKDAVKQKEIKSSNIKAHKLKIYDLKPQNKEIEKQTEMPEITKISLWLDRYDDIFSDFDPRPYSQRSLSDDFLSEAKKVIVEKKTGKIEMNLLTPKEIRDSKSEALIKKRLREYFKKQFIKINEKTNKLKRKGFFLVFFGIIFMMAATYLYTLESKNIFITFLIVLLEPSGWFSTWYGLDQIFYYAKEKKQDLEFNEKMSKCEINFSEY